MATAAACGCGFSAPRALATLVLAACVHAGANVLNDVHDALNGADAANTRPLSRYAGGSRLLQRGEVTLQQARELAWGLLGLAVPAGLLLALHADGGLVLLGAAGLALAWAYSAPPLALMARGLGELAVGLAWWLVVIGADYVQRRAFFVIPAVTAVPFALLVAGVLLVNGYPDAGADASVGKRTLAVRLGHRHGALCSAALAVAGAAWQLAWVAAQVPPVRALWGLAALPLSLAGAWQLWRHGADGHRLRGAIRFTAAAAIVHALATAAGIASLRWA